MRKTTRLLATFLMLLIVVVALTGCIKSDEEKDAIRQEETHKGGYYKGLSEEEQQEFDDKLKTIFEHDDYKDLSDDEKNDLVERFVESEKLQTEIKKEQEEQNQRQEELEEELGALSEELNNIFTSEEELSHSEQVSQVAGAIANTKNELKDIINSSASTANEIAEAQEKLDQVEALEQEYASSQTTSSIINALENDRCFQGSAGNYTLNKINGIYFWGGNVLVDAELVKTENIAGAEICTKVNGFAKCYILHGFDDVNSYAQIIKDINSKSELGDMFFTYTSSNEEWHKDYFEQNRGTLLKDYVKMYEECNVEVSVVSSWESTNDPEHPIYFVAYKLKSSQDILGVDMIKYDDIQQSYLKAGKIENICPEFWAQLEVEQEKDAQSQSENNVKNVDTSLSTGSASRHVILDSNGEAQGFNRLTIAR